MPEGNGLGGIVRPILDKRWVALVVIGFLGVILAAGKGVWLFHLDEPVARIAVGAIGILVIVIGIWDGLRGADGDKRLTTDYGLRITSPGDNAHVGEEFEVSGTYKKRPPDDIPIRTFIFSPSSGDYWPNARPVIFDESEERWSTSIRPGGNVGDRKLVGIALLGKNAAIVCNYYDAVTRQIIGLRKDLNAQIGIPGVHGIPTDWKECHKVRVTRA
jgi:hypothetical protein